MTAKGRKPKPKPFLLKATGGTRGRKKLTPEASLAPGEFAPPFPLPPIALREWKRILAEAGWLKQSQSVAIADRCICFQRMLEAEEDVQTRGIVTRTRNGKVKNPSVQIARQYRISLQRHDEVLGLTPAGQMRVDTMPTLFDSANREEDPLERKISGEL